MRDRCLPLLVSAPGTIWHDDPGPPAAITSRRKLALWQGARGAATAHRVCEHFSQGVVSTRPSEYRWVVHCTQFPTCPHGRSALPGFCKRGANPRVEMPSGSYVLDIPDACARRASAWRLQQLAPRGVWGGWTPTKVGVLPPRTPTLRSEPPRILASGRAPDGCG